MPVTLFKEKDMACINQHVPQEVTNSKTFYQYHVSLRYKTLEPHLTV